MEDGNLGESFLTQMLSDAVQDDDPDLIAFAQMMLAMTPTQRRKVQRGAPSLPNRWDVSAMRRREVADWLAVPAPRAPDVPEELRVDLGGWPR